MDTQPIKTKADPATDLTGCISEIISAIGRLDTNDDDDGGATTRPMATSVPIIDCTQAIRERVIPSPLFSSGSFLAAWTVGELSNGRILAMGMTNGAGSATWASIFSLATLEWSAPVPVPAIKISCPDAKLFALATRVDRFVAYADDKVHMFCVASDGALEPLASIEVPREVASLAVTTDGNFVAAVLKGDNELWLFRYTDRCLTLCQTVPAEQDHAMAALAFSSDGTRLAICGQDNVVQLFPIQAVELDPICPPVAWVVTMPSDAQIIDHYAEKDKALQHDTAELALWLSLGDQDTVTLATRHHLSIVRGGTRHFIMDRAYAVAALVHDQFYAVLDAAGMVTLRDYDNNTRQVIPPEQRGMQSEFRVAVPQCCECCAARANQMPSTKCHPVMSLSSDGKKLIIVDQWSVARVAVASL